MPKAKPKTTRKKKRGNLGLILIFVGILIMFVGALSELVPLSGVSFGPEEGVQISGISPFDASLIGIGAIIFTAGIGLYLKGK